MDCRLKEHSKHVSPMSYHTGILIILGSDDEYQDFNTDVFSIPKLLLGNDLGMYIWLQPGKLKTCGAIQWAGSYPFSDPIGSTSQELSRSENIKHVDLMENPPQHHGTYASKSWKPVEPHPYFMHRIQKKMEKGMDVFLLCFPKLDLRWCFLDVMGGHIGISYMVYITW